MKKGFKGLLTGLCLAFALLLASCGVNAKAADKINEAAKNGEAWTVEQVEKKYGEPTSGGVLAGMGSYVYVKGCDSWDDVKAKLEKGEKLEALVVEFVGGKAVAAQWIDDYKGDKK